MENKRHEKAILIGTAYFIGFLTASIFYNFSYSKEVAAPTNSNFNTNSNLEQNLVISDPHIERTTSENHFSYSNGDLNVFTQNGLKVLSINPTISERDIDETTLSSNSQGIHFNDPAITISNDKNFLYFCEQQSSEASYCTGYIYDFVNDEVNPITTESKLFTISLNLADAISWNENGLSLGDLKSTDKNTPWILAE